MSVNLKATFLTENEIRKSEVLSNYGTAKAIATDFSLLLGVDDGTYHSVCGEYGTIGEWWIMPDTNDIGHSCLPYVDASGSLETYGADYRCNGARPVLHYSDVKPYLSLPRLTGINKDILEVEFGEYPQSVVKAELNDELEDNFNYFNPMKKTGRTWTYDCNGAADNDISFAPAVFEEYEYQG